MKTRIFLILCGALLLSMFSFAFAQAPRTISFQGVLAKADGQFISDGMHEIQLRIYETPAGGPAVYVETQTVLVVRGIFNVLIGSTLEEGLPMSLPFNRAYFLGVSVDGRTELAPRTPFTSVPYALFAEKSIQATEAVHAESADHALHADNADMAQRAEVVMGGAVISLNDLQGDVTLSGNGNTTITHDIEDYNNLVVDTKGPRLIRNYDGSLLINSPEGPFVDMAVGPEGINWQHLKDQVIITRKLADAAVTNAKLAYASVTGSKIADNAVNTTKMSTEGAMTEGQVLTYDGESLRPFWSNMFMGTFSGDGFKLSLRADSLVQGTINDARLSENVPLIDAENEFTAPTNSFEGVHASGLQVNSDIGDKAIEVMRGRTILSYATVRDDEVIPADVNVVQADGSWDWRMTDVRLPNTEENGQVLCVVCNDPNGCLVYDPINNEQNSSSEEMTGAEKGPNVSQESAMSPETFEFGRFIPYREGRVFVRVGLGWVWMF